MRPKRPEEEQRELRAAELFERKLARASTRKAALDLAHTPMKQRAPGYRLYRDLAYFLQHGSVPDGASKAEAEAMRAFEKQIGGA